MIYTTPAGKTYDIFTDALSQPHLLIAGATGSGKSVIINGLIYTALYSLPIDIPGGKEFILIDPKRVELVQWKEMPHTIKYASEPTTIIAALQYAMQLCEKRYTVMQAAGIRKYQGSDVYVIIDEFADLMTTNKRAVKPIIQRLAQIGRAARIHIILATQTPISAIIPTEIKCNFDARFALRTRSKQDSRNITGFAGCELLPRYGECYYITPAETTHYIVPYIPEPQLDEMAAYWTRQTRQQEKPEKKNSLLCRLKNHIIKS